MESDAVLAVRTATHRLTAEHAAKQTRKLLFALCVLIIHIAYLCAGDF